MDFMEILIMETLGATTLGVGAAITNLGMVDIMAHIILAGVLAGAGAGVIIIALGVLVIITLITHLITTEIITTHITE
ncbi:hypothetical protein ACFSO9_15815 [Mesonia maritima]|uniref:hypothetical protein n=1 Tax=Mesonia maritima TaxID=1793873 RepID=UPI00364333E0